MHDHRHANGHHPRSHDHEHRHEVGVSGYGLAPAPGHNAAARVAQWQEPHRHEESGAEQPEPDFDLIEASFAENFPKASDPTSFLRLARIPFVGRDSDGRVLHLLRVEYERATDVGALTPQLGGGTHRHDPLPAPLVSTRQRLRFAYSDDEGIVHLSLAGTRRLSEATGGD